MPMTAAAPARAGARAHPPGRTSRRALLGAIAGFTGGALLAACGQLAPAGGELPIRDWASALSSGEPAAGLPGKLLYVGDSDIWTWEHGTARRLTQDRISRHPSWSPDGRQIALTKIDVSASEVWVMDADSSNSRRLTHNSRETVAQSNWAFRPIWWPDGSRLLYLSEEASRDLMLWQINLDGKSRKPFLTLPDSEGGLEMPSLSPDAKRLALVTFRNAGARSQIWTYALPNGPWRQVTEAPEGAYDPAWSPDGARLAYTARDKGRHDVWVMGADGANPQPATQNGASRAPAWSPDGETLAYISAQTGVFDLWAVPAPSAGGAAAVPVAAPKQLTRKAALDAVSGLSWAA